MAKQRPELAVSRRESVGKNKVRTMRQKAPVVPGIVYGKGQPNQPITCDHKALATIIKQGHHIITVKGDGTDYPALFKDVQFDTYGESILHFDLARVSLTDRVKVQVPIEFWGEDQAPGLKAGGTIDRVRTSVEVECPVLSIPDSVRVDLSKLQLNEHLTAGKIALPADVKLILDANVNVAVCHQARQDEEGAAPAAGEAGAAREPEVIKPERKAEDEEGEKKK